MSISGCLVPSLFAASSQAQHPFKLALPEQKHDDEDFYISRKGINTVKALYLAH